MLLFCRLLKFFKISFLKKKIRSTFRVSNSLDQVQDRRSVGPDLGTNLLYANVISRRQKLSRAGKELSNYCDYCVDYWGNIWIQTI